MEEQKISIETAKLAKEKGFKIPGKIVYVKTGNIISTSIRNSTYNNCKNWEMYLKPTQSLLQKWLREIHNIDIIIWKNSIDGSYRVEDILLNNKELTDLEFEDSFDNYENALEEGLYEALKLI